MVESIIPMSKERSSSSQVIFIPGFNYRTGCTYLSISEAKLDEFRKYMAREKAFIFQILKLNEQKQHKIIFEYLLFINRFTLITKFNVMRGDE